MILFILKRCNKQQYNAAKEILSASKFTLLTVLPEEGVTNEINHNLNNTELFNLYRKFRKKYFKLKNYE